MPLSMALMDTAKKYRQMQEDGRILSNRDAINVIDSRILQLLDRVDHDDAPDRMKVLLGLWEQTMDAKTRRNDAEFYACLSALDAEFGRAYHDYEGWRQIMEILDTRRKMVDSEVKVIKDMKAILTAEQAYNLVAKLLAAIIDVVKDPKALRQINYRFSRIVGEHRLEEHADVVEMEAEGAEE